jgi:hypothetical protein
MRTKRPALKQRPKAIWIVDGAAPDGKHLSVEAFSASEAKAEAKRVLKIEGRLPVGVRAYQPGEEAKKRLRFQQKMGGRATKRLQREAARNAG